ncbi:primosomal replication protein, partial [Escherichia coli]|nr:primosomal replication protein [Escherichia coli]
MKTALLLEKLEGQLATLRQRCAPVSQFATLSARFDRHLFQTRATTITDFDRKEVIIPNKAFVTERL